MVRSSFGDFMSTLWRPIEGPRVCEKRKMPVFLILLIADLTNTAVVKLATLANHDAMPTYSSSCVGGRTETKRLACTHFDDSAE